VTDYFASVRQKPAPPPTHTLTPVNTGQATSYAAAALRSECAQVAATTEGSRNAALNSAAFRMGRHIGAGNLDPQIARAALWDAGRACGLPDHEIDVILRDDTTGGLNNGAAVPRHPEARPDHLVPVVTVLEDGTPAPDEPRRGVIVRGLADVQPRKPTWLWDNRIPAGELTLLAGAEGSGKSTITADLAAQVTRGQLDGHYRGTPRGLLFVGVEDSIEETLVPRLIAAGADMTRVSTIDHAFDHETGLPVMLTLPRDLLAVVEAAQAHDVALVVLDPIGSRLGSLDTHKDAEVRAALEPLVSVFRTARIATLGLIHVNKDREATGTTDALMGSRAFPAVARAVHLVTRDDNERFMSMIKSNLGTEMPDLLFDTIADGDSSKIQWKGERPRMGDMERADCRAWLEAYVSASGGQALLEDIRKAARPEGWSDGQLRRARASLRLVTSRTHDFPSKTVWELPAASVLPGGHN
jgi:energy-coupling factor transporter ATP-binding protein EcfA2